MSKLKVVRLSNLFNVMKLECWVVELGFEVREFGFGIFVVGYLVKSFVFFGLDVYR